MVVKSLLATGFLILASSAYASNANPQFIGENGEKSIAFAPDGKWLVTAGTDGLVRIRDGTTGAVLASLAGHRSVVNSVAVSPDGRTIASVSNDFSARLWDVERRVEQRSLVVPRAMRNNYSYCVLAVAFAPDGRTIATGDTSGLIQLWNVETGEMEESWAADPKAVYQIIYSPDGQTIASVGSDPVMKLWDARSHTLRRSLLEPGRNRLRIAYSPDGTTLAAARGMTLSLWNPDTGVVKDRQRECPDVVTAITFTPDNSFLVFGGYRGSRLFEIHKQNKSDDRWTLLIPPPYIDDCSAVAVSPDGRWVAHCFTKFNKLPETPFKLIAIR